jgi:hypothetical protein
LPSGYVVSLTRAKTGDLQWSGEAASAWAVSMYGKKLEPNPPLGQKIDEGSLLWVYMGHGYTTALDYVDGDYFGQMPKSILSVDDVPKLRGGARCPVAMFVTCLAGRCDGPEDGLAEELVLAEEGPVSVLAATSVPMPYGNTVFSYEFLRASLGDRPATLGRAFLFAQKRTLADGGVDPMRRSIETMALGLCPILPTAGERWQAKDLVTERREHVAMYHLLGDPLLRWRRPRPMKLSVVPESVAKGGPIVVEGVAEFAGNCLIEVARAYDVDTSNTGDSTKGLFRSESLRVAAGEFRATLPVPKGIQGPLTVRAYLSGEAESAVGGQNVEFRATP